MKSPSLLVALCLFSASSMAQTLVVEMTDLNSGKSAGTIEISENDYGTVFSPSLSGIPDGLHGFHLHENSSCDSSTKNGKTVLGGAAGGHYDPEGTGKHGFSWTRDNHLGDLPALYANSEGVATQPVLAPRVKMSDLSGRAVMIHAGGDNHSDHPAKLGGGGARIVCGVIK
ncbi:superoxide dismutase family protein [Hahella ganghwensis]|uniref:superoxide dismutase family protein n=1 Tax=Hahella ganghwensis TaxID=286420 RepID=UPI00036200C7|nr:superoxide dismutase family protein [Hahella ganghwensis]